MLTSNTFSLALSWSRSPARKYVARQRWRVSPPVVPVRQASFHSTFARWRGSTWKFVAFRCFPSLPMWPQNARDLVTKPGDPPSLDLKWDNCDTCISKSWHSPETHGLWVTSFPLAAPWFGQRRLGLKHWDQGQSVNHLSISGPGSLSFRPGPPEHFCYTTRCTYVIPQLLDKTLLRCFYTITGKISRHLKCRMWCICTDVQGWRGLEC